MRWLSVVTDLRIWAGLAISGILMFLTVGFFGWSLTSTLEQREADLAAMTPEERTRVELRTIDRLGRELAGVGVGEKLDEVMVEQERMLAELEANGELDPEAALAYDEMLDELRRSRQSLAEKPAGPVEIPRVGSQQAESARLVPAWAIAGAFGLGILVLGGIASLLVLRRPEEEAEEAAK